MKIVSLKKLVEENDINIVQVDMGDGVNPVSFDVGSPDYREQQLYFVTGDFQIGKGDNGENILKVNKLEEEMSIQTSQPHVVTEEEEKIDEHVNTPVTAIVFNRKTLQSAGRDTHLKHVTSYAYSVIEAFKKQIEPNAQLDDFAVVEVDFGNKTVSLKSIAPLKTKEEDTE
jgi:hypothetical protein